jgi:hypothetical protein
VLRGEFVFSFENIHVVPYVFVVKIHDSKLRTQIVVRDISVVKNLKKRLRRVKCFFALFLFSAMSIWVLQGSPCLSARAADCPDMSAEEQAFEKDLESFFSDLTKLPDSKAQRIFGKYTGVLGRELDMGRLYSCSYREIEELLDSAVEKSIDALMLFTFPFLQRKDSRALVLDKEMLLRLNRRYNLHALFLISANCADDDSKVRMKFLVTGQGKFIVGYERKTIIRHPEYTIATGKYEYRELFVMEPKTGDKGNWGLFDIRGLSGLTGKFEPMKGPLNADIRSLSFTSESGNEKKILVIYDLLGTRKEVVDRLPIERVPQKKGQAMKK